jgi:hypothetical protein
MRETRILLVAAFLVGVAAAAGAGELTLTRAGDLYQVGETEAGLAVNVILNDDSTAELLVPQTAGIGAQSIHVGVDELSGSVFVLWQEGTDVDSRVVFANYTQDTWFGPMVLAGGDGTAAMNPELLIFRHSAEVQIEGEEEPRIYEDTFLHIAWWGFVDLPNEGSAHYVGLPLDEVGMPDFAEFEPRMVSELLPFGINCTVGGDAPALLHPRLFVDPESGNPHIFATDLGQCLLQIIELKYQPRVESLEKRRRRVVEFGRARMLTVRGDVNLATAKVGIGHNLSVVMFWDEDEKVDFIRADESGWSEMRSLTLGEGLTKDTAVELIRDLAH